MSSSNGNQQQGSMSGVKGSRRHSRSKSVDSLADLVAPLSPTELLERIASEAWLCAELALKLYSYLGLGECQQPTWFVPKYNNQVQKCLLTIHELLQVASGCWAFTGLSCTQCCCCPASSR
jgi:hypothetical protein